MPRGNRPLIIATLLLSTAGFANPVAARATTKTNALAFDIPAQPVASAMGVFAKQSGVQILFPYDRVRDMRTHAIAGVMTPQAALDLMIAGTGLRVARSDNGVVALAATRDGG